MVCFPVWRRNSFHNRFGLPSAAIATCYPSPISTSMQAGRFTSVPRAETTNQGFRLHLYIGANLTRAPLTVPLARIWLSPPFIVSLCHCCSFTETPLFLSCASNSRKLIIRTQFLFTKIWFWQCLITSFKPTSSTSSQLILLWGGAREPKRAEYASGPPATEVVRTYLDGLRLSAKIHHHCLFFKFVADWTCQRNLRK